MAPTTRSAAAVQSQEDLIAQFKSLLEQEVGKVRDEARDEAAASNQRHAAELASVKADAEKRERALSARVDMQAIHIGRLNHDLALVAGLSEWPKDGYALVTRADGRPGLALELVRPAVATAEDSPAPALAPEDRVLDLFAGSNESVTRIALLISSHLPALVDKRAFAAVSFQILSATAPDAHEVAVVRLDKIESFLATQHQRSLLPNRVTDLLKPSVLRLKPYGGRPVSPTVPAHWKLGIDKVTLNFFVLERSLYAWKPYLALLDPKHITFQSIVQDNILPTPIAVSRATCDTLASWGSLEIATFSGKYSIPVQGEDDDINRMVALTSDGRAPDVFRIIRNNGQVRTRSSAFGYRTVWERLRGLKLEQGDKGVWLSAEWSVVPPIKE